MGTKIYEVITSALWEQDMKHTQVFKLFSHFIDGRTSVESDVRAGCPCDSKKCMFWREHIEG
jgi:hypothetical protein